jgi:hypothetical protein
MYHANFILWYWGLNLEPYVCLADALPLEPHSACFLFLVLFFR